MKHFFLCLLFAFLSACGRQAERAELVVINGAEPDTIDPAKIRGQPEGRVANSLFEGLTRSNQEGEAEQDHDP